MGLILPKQSNSPLVRQFQQIFPKTKVYPNLATSHPGVRRGTIQQSLIHTLIINSPLTITQFWVPVTVFATVIAYGFRYQVSDFLDDLGNRDYKQWLADRENIRRKQDMMRLWNIEGIAANRAAANSLGDREWANKEINAAYEESERSRLHAEGTKRMLF
jgi:hypothetical protein